MGIYLRERKLSIPDIVVSRLALAAHFFRANSNCVNVLGH